MQNAGLQYGQGVTPVQESPFSTLQNNASSSTSTLRQFRKKDNVDKVSVGGGGHTSAGVDPANSSHVARVPPHNHYPHKPNEYFRYSSIYDDYNSPYKDHTVKYSEIAESVQQNIPHLDNLPPSVLAKHKEKDYVDMCNIQQQTHFNKPYPDHQFNGQQGYHPPEMALHHQYMHKEPQGPQMHSSYKPESQYIPKDGTFNHQISPFLKYNIPQSRNYGHLDNGALAPFQRMDPHIARSLMSEHPHMRDFSAEYSPMEQSRIYAQKQRYYSAPIPTNASYQPNYAHRNLPAQQYNYPSCSYPRTQVNARIGRYPPINMERSISPRRGYTENLEMGMNFNPVHQKLTSGYPNYPAYAQHYQHRRPTAAAPQEYYHHHHQQQPTHVRPHPQYIPAHHSQEVGENHVASNNIRQYLENWAEEEPSGEIQSSSQIVDNPSKYISRINNRDEENEVYVINASELPQYLESGVPLVTSENGQYIFKSNVSIDNATGTIKILEKNVVDGGNTQVLPAEAQERIVNLHIVENPKSDCLVNPKPTNLTQETNQSTITVSATAASNPVQTKASNNLENQNIYGAQQPQLPYCAAVVPKPNNLVQQVPPMTQTYENNAQQFRKLGHQSENHSNSLSAEAQKTTRVVNNGDDDSLEKTNLKIEMLSSFNTSNDVPHQNQQNSCIVMPSTTSASSITTTTNQNNNRLNFDESLLPNSIVVPSSCNNNSKSEENLVVMPGMMPETHEELDKIVEDTLTSSHIDIPMENNCETKIEERCGNHSNEENMMRIPDDLNLDLESNTKFLTGHSNDYHHQMTRNNINNSTDVSDDIMDLSTSRRGSQEETSASAPSIDYGGNVVISHIHNIGDFQRPSRAKDLPVLLEPEDLSRVEDKHGETDEKEEGDNAQQQSSFKHMPLIDDNEFINRNDNLQNDQDREDDNKPAEESFKDGTEEPTTQKEEETEEILEEQQQPDKGLLPPEEKLRLPEEKLLQPEEKFLQPEEKLLQPEEKLLQPEEKLLQPEENLPPVEKLPPPEENLLPPEQPPQVIEENEDVEMKNDAALERKLCEIVGEPCDEIPKMAESGKNEDSSIFSSSSDMEDTRDCASEVETLENVENKTEEDEKSSKETENETGDLDRKMENANIEMVTSNSEEKKIEENSVDYSSAIERTTINNTGIISQEEEKDESTTKKEDTCLEVQNVEIPQTEEDLNKIEANRSEIVNTENDQAGKQEKKKEGIRKKRIFSVDDIIYRIGPKSIQNRRKSVHSTLEDISVNEENTGEMSETNNYLPTNSSFTEKILEKEEKIEETVVIVEDKNIIEESFEKKPVNELNNNETFASVVLNEYSSKNIIPVRNEEIRKKIKILSNQILEVGRKGESEILACSTAIDQTEGFIPPVDCKMKINDDYFAMHVENEREEVENNSTMDQEEMEEENKTNNEDSKIRETTENNFETLREEIEDCEEHIIEDHRDETEESMKPFSEIKEEIEQQRTEDKGEIKEHVQEDEKSERKLGEIMEGVEENMDEIEGNVEEVEGSIQEVEETKENMQVVQQMEKMELNKHETSQNLERSTVIRRTTDKNTFVEETKEIEETKDIKLVEQVNYSNEDHLNSEDQKFQKCLIDIEDKNQSATIQSTIEDSKSDHNVIQGEETEEKIEENCAKIVEEECTKENEKEKLDSSFKEQDECNNKKTSSLRKEEKSFEEKFVEPLFAKVTEEDEVDDQIPMKRNETEEIETKDVQSENEAMMIEENYGEIRKIDGKDEKDIEEEKYSNEVVQYRNVLKIEEDNVLLEICGELVEIGVNEVNGKKIITVTPMSNTATVDFNDNYEQLDRTTVCEESEEARAKPTFEGETVRSHFNSPEREMPVLTKMVVSSEDEKENEICNDNKDDAGALKAITNSEEIFQDVISNENEIIIGDESLEEEINLDLQNKEDPIVEEKPVQQKPFAICTKAAKKLYDEIIIPSSKTSNSLREFRRIKGPNNSATIKPDKSKTKKEAPQQGKSSKRSVRFSTRQKKNPDNREESQNALRELIKRRKMRKEKIRLKYSQYAKGQNVENHQIGSELGMREVKETSETLPKVASHIVKLEKEQTMKINNDPKKVEFKKNIQRDVKVKSKIEESRKRNIGHQMASVVVLKQKNVDFGLENDDETDADKQPSTVVVTSTVPSTIADQPKKVHAHPSTSSEGTRSHAHHQEKHQKFSNASHPVRDLSLTKNVNEHYLSRKDHSNLKKKLSIQEYNSRKRKGGENKDTGTIEKNAKFVQNRMHHHQDTNKGGEETGVKSGGQHHHCATASTIYSDRQFAFVPNNGIKDPRRRAQYLGNAHTMTRTPSEDSNSSQTSSISSSKSQKSNETCPLIPTTMIINNPTLILHDSYGRELENYKHYKTLLLEKSSEEYETSSRPMKILNRRKTVEVMSSRPKYETNINEPHPRKKVSFDDNVQINEIHTTQSKIGKIKTESSGYYCEVSSSSSDVSEEKNARSTSIKVREMIENDWESSNSPKDFSSTEYICDEAKRIDAATTTTSSTYKKKHGKLVIDINDFDTSLIDNELKSPYRFSTTPTYDNDEGLKNYKDEVDSKLNSLNIQILPNIKQQRQHGKSNNRILSEDDMLMHKFLRKEQLSSEEIKQIRRIIYLKKRIQQLTQQNRTLLTNESNNNNNNNSYELKNLPRNDLKLQFRKVDEAISNINTVKGKNKKRRRFRNLYSDSPDTSESEMLESAGEFSVYEGENMSGVKLIFKRKTDLLRLQPVVKLQRCSHIESMAKKMKIE